MIKRYHMDIALAQNIISAATGALIALITVFLTQTLSKKQILEQDYDKALEELQKNYLDVEVHIEEEIRGWWINMEYGNGNGPKPKKYIYPIDKMRMLAERYEPSSQSSWILTRVR